MTSDFQELLKIIDKVDPDAWKALGEHPDFRAAVKKFALDQALMLLVKSSDGSRFVVLKNS